MVASPKSTPLVGACFENFAPPAVQSQATDRQKKQMAQGDSGSHTLHRKVKYIFLLVYKMLKSKGNPPVDLAFGLSSLPHCETPRLFLLPLFEITALIKRPNQTGV